MIKFLNKQTGEEIVVNSCKMISATEAETLKVYSPKEKFYVSNPMFIFARKTEEGKTVFTISENYEVVSRIKCEKSEKPRTKRTKKSATAPETTETTETTETPAQEPEAEVIPNVEVVPEATEEQAAELTTEDLALILSLKRMRGTSFDRAKAKELVLDVLNELAADDNGKQVLKKATKKATKKADAVRCEDFEDMVEDVRDGFNIYLYGAAGCGKSYTAEMIADALGIPFFGTMQLEFEHQLAGYGDAAGRYVGTPFYQAMTEGGLFFLDEFDRSNQQITTVINTVMESRRFTFPVVGEVVAHPNFRIVAAGNTTMTGLNDEYVGAQVLCASTRNRFEFYEMKYDRRVELPMMAGGDETLMNFVEDIRQSIADAQIQLIVSYRTTKYLHARNDKKAKALKRGLFQGLDADTVRTIYGGLKDKDNDWAKAVKKLF